jgi:gluconolactonase
MTRLVRLQPSGRANETVSIDRNRAALIIQDMQNDAIAEGGAFADSGAHHHAAEQNVVENCRRLADACRKAGVPVIHLWYVVEDGAKGLKLNALLFEGVQESGALVKGSWGAGPVPGLERQFGDLLVEKMRMSGRR